MVSPFEATRLFIVTSLYTNNNTNNKLSTWLFITALLGALILAWWRTAAILPPLFHKSEYQKPIHIPTIAAAPMFWGEFLPTSDNAPQVHSATLVVLPNGELFAAWFGGSREGAADVAIYGAKRTAKGWNISILANRTASERELNRPIRKLGNPVLARTVDGRIWLFFVVTSLGGWSTSAIAYKMSDDAGNHFGPARLLVTSPVLNISTLVRTRPLLYTDGSIALPAYHELLGKFGLMLRISPEARVISIALDGVPLNATELLTQLNAIGGKHGIGRADIVENRYVGMKSRGCYETPGGTILLKAHRAMESLTLDREAAHIKDELMPKYASLIYNGYWFTPERRMLQAAIDQTQAVVNGVVRLKLYKGNVQVVGRKSTSHSLFDAAIVTFEEDAGAYNQNDATGFIRLNALRIKVAAGRGR